MICSLEVMCLDGATVHGIGARDLDRLQDFLEHDAALIAASNGAHVSPVLGPELAMAGHTNHMPSGALYVKKLQEM
jgi:hypothetical protein